MHTMVIVQQNFKGERMTVLEDGHNVLEVREQLNFNAVFSYYDWERKHISRPKVLVF